MIGLCRFPHNDRMRSTHTAYRGRPEDISAEELLDFLARLLAPRISRILAGDGAVAGKPKKPRRKPAPVCKLKPPEAVPTDLEAARARAVLRQMGVRGR